MGRAMKQYWDWNRVEIVVNAADIPWANPHQRDGSTCEENGEEEKWLPAPDIRQSADQRGAQKRQQTLWSSRIKCLLLQSCFIYSPLINQSINRLNTAPLLPVWGHSSKTCASERFHEEPGQSKTIIWINTDYDLAQYGVLQENTVGYKNQTNTKSCLHFKSTLTPFRTFA